MRQKEGAWMGHGGFVGCLELGKILPSFTSVKMVEHA